MHRRTAIHDLRRNADGDLFLYEKRTWDGPDDVSDFEFVYVAARHYTRYHLDGSRFGIDEPRGDRGTSPHTQTSEPPPRLPTPQFGQWHDLLEFAGYGRPDIIDAATHELPVVLAGCSPLASRVGGSVLTQAWPASSTLTSASGWWIGGRTSTLIDSPDDENQ